MRGEELRGAWGDPFGEAVVVFLRGGDLPAHDEEHDVQHSDLLREGGEVGEGPDDVGKDFGERVREDAAFGVEERGDGGVGRADEVLAGDALGGAALALGEEVEEEAVERAGRADVADGGGVGAGGGGVVVVAFGGEDGVGWVGGVGGQLRVAGDGGLLSSVTCVLLGVEQEVEMELFARGAEVEAVRDTASLAVEGVTRRCGLG